MLKVLVAPLDWGLGHATRCIPIIKELINQGCDRHYCRRRSSKNLTTGRISLPALCRNTRIPDKIWQKSCPYVLRLIVSIPKILIRVKQENRWLRRFSRAGQALDLVFSDNRYGLYRRGDFCVFITHQLAIRSSFWARADRLLQRMNYSAIRHFSMLLGPRYCRRELLAGKLSHPRKMPSIPTRYIGWLSTVGTGGFVGGTAGDGGKEAFRLRSAGPIIRPRATTDNPRKFASGTVRPGANCRVVVVGVCRGRHFRSITSERFTVHDHLSARQLRAGLFAGAGGPFAVRIQYGDGSGAAGEEGHLYSDARADRTGISGELSGGKWVGDLCGATGVCR